MDCPGECGTKVGVDADGFLEYCLECAREQDAVKNAYWVLAEAIVRRNDAV